MLTPKMRHDYKKNREYCDRLAESRKTMNLHTEVKKNKEAVKIIFTFMISSKSEAQEAVKKIEKELKDKM